MRARKGHAEFYDSAYGLPDIAATMANPRPREQSSTDLREDEHSVAVIVDALDLRAEVDAALRQTELHIGGADFASEAALVIAELPSTDTRERLMALRRRVRPDAAIIGVLATASGDAIQEAHAAGVFACMRRPLLSVEILGQVRAALDSRHAQNEVADLKRRLDLETHLASIGRMSAGLAHEIGTPLQVALANVTVVKDELSRVGQSSAEIEPMLDDTLRALARLSDVLGTMRGLMSRDRTLRQERIDLRDVVAETRQLLVYELAGVELEVIDEPLFVLTDPTLLGQIVLNLTSNAAHAAKSLSSPRVRLHVYASASQAVISVRDNGPGIAPEMQERIFEPFFTTRRGRGGTGLGLPLCREYALQMGATLSLWSMPGRGACFRLSLPVVC